MSVARERPSVIAGDACLVARFGAMNSPCELLIDGSDESLAERLLSIATAETERIEAKFSRYRDSSLVSQINRAQGRPIEVDDETAGLLDYAAQCFEWSGGLFDVTTGVLRRVWRFDGGDARVDDEALSEARQRMGWNRVAWNRPRFQMPDGFEIDLGGLCKEYAADRILSLLRAETGQSVLVNLGGDLAAQGARLWSVGIEDPDRPGHNRHAVRLCQGGVATSGTTRRYTRVDNRPLGHVLDPRTGRPVEDAPRSVTVAAVSCTEAGFWSTMGLLQGARAEAFLAENELEFWCLR